MEDIERKEYRGIDAPQVGPFEPFLDISCDCHRLLIVEVVQLIGPGGRGSTHVRQP